MAGATVLLWGLPWTWCPRGTLYTVKACSQELGGMQDDTVFLQLDISSALIPYNSGPSWLSFVTTGAQALQRAARSPIGSFHIQCWNSNFSMLSGKSTNKLVPNKGLRTHLFSSGGWWLLISINYVGAGVWQVNCLLSLQGNVHCGAFGTLMMPSAFSAMRHNLPIWSHPWFNAWRAWASTWT